MGGAPSAGPVDRRDSVHRQNSCSRRRRRACPSPTTVVQHQVHHRTRPSLLAGQGADHTHHRGRGQASMRLTCRSSAEAPSWKLVVFCRGAGANGSRDRSIAHTHTPYTELAWSPPLRPPHLFVEVTEGREEVLIGATLDVLQNGLHYAPASESVMRWRKGDSPLKTGAQVDDVITCCAHTWESRVVARSSTSTCRLHCAPCSHVRCRRVSRQGTATQVGAGKAQW